MSVRDMENKTAIGQSVEKKITEKQRQIQGQDQSESIRKSRYINIDERNQIQWLPQIKGGGADNRQTQRCNHEKMKLF